MVVKIYVNDEEGYDDSLEALTNQIKEMNKTILNQDKKINELQMAVNRLNDFITLLKPRHKSKNTSQTKKTVDRKNDSTLFEPSSSTSKLWENLTMENDEIRYVDKKNYKRTIPLSVYEIEIIREANKKTILNHDYKELCELFPVSNQIVSKAIYNIRNNPEFENLLHKLHQKIINCKFHITTEGFIKIGKTVTPITKELANEWVLQCQNKDNLQKLIYNIQKAYPDIEKMQIKIICENYNNSKLLDLIKEDKKSFVENNPSKRRNLLQNGGTI